MAKSTRKAITTKVSWGTMDLKKNASKGGRKVMIVLTDGWNNRLKDTLTSVRAMKKQLKKLETQLKKLN